MSSAPPAPANTAPAGGGPGRPKRPGWWWKMRKERLKRQKQRQAAENASGAQETPTAPAAQNNPEAGGAAAPKKKRKKRKSKRNKKKARDDNPVLPNLPRTAISEIDEESEPDIDEPLQHFFSQYEGFTYDPSIAPTDEFRRLRGAMDWKQGPQAAEARADFDHAIVAQFKRMYGGDANDLSSWQRLCRRIGIDPIPDDLLEAKETVCNTHVNLIDLTMPLGDTKIRIFPSEVALSRYTRKTGKKFPQSEATGTLLYSLLRRIDSPPPEGTRRNANNDVIAVPG